MVQDLLLRLEHIETDLTLETALFGRMQRQVFPETQQRRVLLIAAGLVTSVHLLAGTVHLYVVLQVVFSVERPFAHLTTERFPVGMDERVPHQLEPGRERFLAVVALVRRRAPVDLLVFGQTGRVREALLTDGTLERFLALGRLGFLAFAQFGGALGSCGLEAGRSRLVQAWECCRFRRLCDVVHLTVSYETTPQSRGWGVGVLKVTKVHLSLL